MELAETRASGFLELYVLHDCSDKERAIVEDALRQYPELSKDLYQIGGALEKYARLHEVQPSDGLKEEILEKALSSKSNFEKSNDFSKGPKKGGSFPQFLGWLFSILTLVLGYLFFDASQERLSLQNELDNTRIYCDSLQRVSDLQFAELNFLRHPGNTILPVQATDKYQMTDIYLVYNAQTKQNYVQVTNLPELGSDQSFQLWSLKADEAPIPLTVFQDDIGFIFPVAFEEGTATYAITIEPFGGLQSPSLENLIGTVNVPT